MDTKSTKNEVELPLLDKTIRKQPSNVKSQSYSSSKKATNAHIPKYFDVNFVSKLFFSWVNQFIYVIASKTTDSLFIESRQQTIPTRRPL